METFVKVWRDYTEKYGLGYMLSNGCIGFVFNDYSKIICNPTGEFFDYMEKENGLEIIFNVQGKNKILLKLSLLLIIQKLCKRNRLCYSSLKIIW